jgi:hypothetical protein
MFKAEIANDQTITEMAKENREVFKAEGIRVVAGWNSKSPYGDLIGKDFHFLDHLYMLKYGNYVTYCSEPYGLEAEDLIELAFLTTDGWDVSIGQLPIWYPGRTTQIMIRKRKR